MNALVLTILCLMAFALGYRFYSRFFSRKILAVPDDCRMPSRELQDDVDFVPTHRAILFGHHFATIAGLGPIVGPALAILWGWVPVVLWVVLGTIFIGAVHDYSALVLSVRNRGEGIGSLTGKILGGRARLLFLVVIFFLLVLAMGVFVIVVANLLTHAPGHPTEWRTPQAVLPSLSLMFIAVLVGFLHHRKRFPLLWLTLGGVVLSLAMVWLGTRFPIHIGNSTMRWSLLGYAFLASVLPVWLLLQPRDYLNSFQLYLGLFLLYIGILLARPDIHYPAFRGVAAAGAETASEGYGAVVGLPLLFPFLFITVACGACSGFHNLVASGTTARQLERPRDARPIGYLGMVAEGVVAIAVVVACIYGIQSSDSLRQTFSSWSGAEKNTLGAFVNGSAGLFARIGIPVDFGKTLISTVIVSFALTTLDSGTRLLRFNFEAMGEALRITPLRNRYLASLLAALSIGFFAFLKMHNPATGKTQEVGMTLWVIFGTTNQILAALGLLVVSVYLFRKGKPTIYTFIPMVFMLAITIVAMSVQLHGFLKPGGRNWPLIITGFAVLILSLWLLLEAFITFQVTRRRRAKAGGEIQIQEELG